MNLELFKVQVHVCLLEKSAWKGVFLSRHNKIHDTQALKTLHELKPDEFLKESEWTEVLGSQDRVRTDHDDATRLILF
jgi:hypothetical protein